MPKNRGFVEGPKAVFGSLARKAWTQPPNVRVSVVLGLRLERSSGTCPKQEQYYAIRRGSHPRYYTSPQLGSA